MAAPAGGSHAFRPAGSAPGRVGNTPRAHRSAVACRPRRTSRGWRMSPRFTEGTAESFVDMPAPRTPGHQQPARNLLVQDTVLMTVLAQDPSVVGPTGPVRARIPVPAGRLQRGPRGHRFSVVDEEAGAAQVAPPVVLT